MSSNVGPILVTGASSGIGKAITELLSERGRTVYATARRTSDLDALAGLPGVMPIKLDVTRDDLIRNLTQTIRKRKRGLYGLVNNAGIAVLGPLVDTSSEDLDRVLEVNFCGMHRVVRACFPFLRRSRGRIVNISSINGVAPVEFGGAYSASKFALEAYSDVLRAELGELGIRVSVVEPGGFRSAIVTNMISREGSSSRQRTADHSVEKRYRKFMAEFAGTPEDRDRSVYPEPRPVAEAVARALFARSPKARYLVGNTEEMDWTISCVIRLLAQVSGPEGRNLSRGALLKRVRSARA